MPDCRTNAAIGVVALRGRQTRTLQIVLGINVVMFAVDVIRDAIRTYDMHDRESGFI